MKHLIKIGRYNAILYMPVTYSLISITHANWYWITFYVNNYKNNKNYIALALYINNKYQCLLLSITYNISTYNLCGVIQLDN